MRRNSAKFSVGNLEQCDNDDFCQPYRQSVRIAELNQLDLKLNVNNCDNNVFEKLHSTADQLRSALFNLGMSCKKEISMESQSVGACSLPGSLLTLNSLNSKDIKTYASWTLSLCRWMMVLVTDNAATHVDGLDLANSLPWNSHSRYLVMMKCNSIGKYNDEFCSAAYSLKDRQQYFLLHNGSIADIFDELYRGLFELYIFLHCVLSFPVGVYN